jgi:hypothetical protein
MADKGSLAKMFEPWHSRMDQENHEFNNVAFSKLYNFLIEATHIWCIPQELLNLNTQNITFRLNGQNTLVWPRHTNLDEFHSRFIPFYLYAETFNNEVMSWTGLKHNSCKSKMHYLLPTELLMEKGK